MSNECWSRLRVGGPPDALVRFVRCQIGGHGLEGPGLNLLLAPIFGADPAAELRASNLRIVARGPRLLDYHFETTWEPPLAWLAGNAAAHPQLWFELMFAGYVDGFFGEVRYEAGTATINRELELDEALHLFDERGWDIEADQQYGHEASLGLGFEPVSVVQDRVRRAREFVAEFRATVGADASADRSAEVQRSLLPDVDAPAPDAVR